jgi:diguanylate cyclase (GGDEF)-like protein
MAVGSVNRLRGKDFHTRRVRLVNALLTQSEPIYELSVEMLAHQFRMRPRYTSGAIDFLHREGSPRLSVRLKEDNSVPIRYYVRSKDITVVPVLDLLEDQVPLEAFKDKIVLVGATGYIFHDMHPTPLGVEPGVMLIANIWLTLLRGEVPEAVPLLLQWAFLLLSTLAVAWLSYRYRPWVVALGIGAGMAGYAALSYGLDRHNLHWDLVGPPVAWVCAYVFATLHRYMVLTIEAVQLRVLATTDSLTGVSNRRYMQVRMEHELARVERYGDFFSGVLFDVDNFKGINDTYGHAKGDEVLVAITDILKRRARRADLIGRLGGDEFCAVLFHTDQDGAYAFAEHLLKELTARRFAAGGGSFQASLSIGIVTVRGPRKYTWEGVLELADQAAYTSKRGGKNRVSIYPKDCSAQANP